MAIAERNLEQVAYKNDPIKAPETPVVSIPQGLRFEKTANGYVAIPLTQGEMDWTDQLAEENAHDLTNRLHAFHKLVLTAETIEGETKVITFVPNALYQENQPLYEEDPLAD